MLITDATPKIVSTKLKLNIPISPQLIAPIITKINAMYKIQLNATGTRFLNITDEHLQTIKDYALFRDLIDSNGYVDEDVLDKLKMNIRSIIGSTNGDVENLLRLAADVIYHDKMKAYGLRQLIMLYVSWTNKEKVGTDGK